MPPTDDTGTLQECEDCHDEFDLWQIRMSPDGHFRCDDCTEHDSKAWNPLGQFGTNQV